MKKNIFNIVILMIIIPLIVYSNSMGDQMRKGSPNSIKIELDFVSVGMSNYNPEKNDSIRLKENGQSVHICNLII